MFISTQYPSWKIHTSRISLDLPIFIRFQFYQNSRDMRVMDSNLIFAFSWQISYLIRIVFLPDVRKSISK